MASTYAAAQWTNPKTNTVSTGAPVIYTVTIPSTVKNKDGAIAFVNYLLSSQGQNIFTQSGLSTTPIQASGDKQAIPQQLQSYIQS
jgi:ABC-type molybdate transport system substrate-binding protein